MKFSIVTPVYNAEKYVARTVESVLAQTYCDWEHICVDDGSADSSGAILDEFAAKDNRIKVVHQSNGGEGAARNSALKVATGDWIVFLDADDLLSPWALAEHARVVSECPHAMMTRLEMLQFDGDNDPDWNQLNRMGKSLRVVDVRKIIPFEMSVAHFFQFAYRRSLIDGVEFTRHYVGADRVFLMKCLVQNDFVACSCMISHAYRQTADSIMGSRMTLRKLRDRQLYIRECLECVERDGEKKLSSAAWREFGTTLTECSVYDIDRMQKSERYEAWQLWQSWLPWMAALHGFTTWRKISIAVAKSLRWVPFHIVPRLLLGLPWRMKLKGVHR